MCNNSILHRNVIVYNNILLVKISVVTNNSLIVVQ